MNRLSRDVIGLSRDVIGLSRDVIGLSRDVIGWFKGGFEETVREGQFVS